MHFVALAALVSSLSGIPHGLAGAGGPAVDYFFAHAGFRGFRYFSRTCQKPTARHHCHFNWTNRAAMVEKVNDRIKYRQKQFLRFNVPVFHYDRMSGKWVDSREFETWVWVAYTHEYMLFFPHNFNVLSLGTMGIITNDFWEPGGEGRIDGKCDPSCLKFEMAAYRCALTKDDLLSFMRDAVNKEKTDWNYVCRQLSYDLTDVIHHPNSAIPDLFYYWRFLRQLFTRRRYFGIGLSKDDFVHYNCFDKDGNLKQKELLMKYFVIVLLALILWLYSPLLIHYFPSTRPELPADDLPNKNFYATHESPVCFMNSARDALGYHMPSNASMKPRLRRLFFLAASLVLITRFFFSPHSRFCLVLTVFVIAAASIPAFWSVHLSTGTEQPTHFLDSWEYSEGLYRRDSTKRGYQFLAHCMKERFYLALEPSHWKMIFSNSFNGSFYINNHPALGTVKVLLSIFRGTIIFVIVALLTIAYHLVPAFYFYKKMFFAIATATRVQLLQISPNAGSCFVGALTTTIGFASSVILCAYFMIASMFYCYLFVEVTMFTYIGAVIDPTMAFKYVSLVGAISIVLYNLAKGLRETYEKLQNQTVDVLQKSDHLPHLRKSVSDSVVLEEQKDEPNGGLKIFLRIPSKDPKLLLDRDHFRTLLARPLFDFIAEQCDPVRRRVMFIIFKVVLMTFYVGIAMWIKNVFHKEKDVSNIFGIAQNIAMYFVPNLLQFLANKRGQGTNDVVLHQQVHDALTAYIKKEEAAVVSSKA